MKTCDLCKERIDDTVKSIKVRFMDNIIRELYFCDECSDKITHPFPFKVSISEHKMETEDEI